MTLVMTRSFNEWRTIPVEKIRKGDEAQKPLLYQVNYDLLRLHLAGNS